MSVLSAIRLIVALVLVAAVASYRQPARAQIDSREAIALQNQILDMRRQMQALQDQVARGGGGSPTYLSRGASAPPAGGANDLVAQLLSRVDALEEQVRQLRGRTDETANQVQRLGADLSKRIDDQAFQAQNSQEIGQPPRGAPPPAQSSQFPPSSNLALTPPPTSLGGPYAAGPRPPPGSPGVPRTPEVAMQEGNAALARRDYQTAEQAAREVLTGSRTSPRAYDAQFLLAQALLGERQFPQSAIAYDDTYNRARKGAHAQDAMLGLANSLIAINEKKAACDTLVKLRTEFPSPRPDLREAISELTQRAGCR